MSIIAAPLTRKKQQQTSKLLAAAFTVNPQDIVYCYIASKFFIPVSFAFKHDLFARHVALQLSAVQLHPVHSGSNKKFIRAELACRFELLRTCDY